MIRAEPSEPGGTGAGDVLGVGVRLLLAELPHGQPHLLGQFALVGIAAQLGGQVETPRLAIGDMPLIALIDAVVGRLKNEKDAVRDALGQSRLLHGPAKEQDADEDPEGGGRETGQGGRRRNLGHEQKSKGADGGDARI